MKKQNSFRTIIRFAVLALAFFFLTACAAKIKTTDLLSVTQSISPDTSQILLVANDSFSSFAPGKIYALEKSYFSWRQAMPPFDAVVGRNGFAPPGEKKEGDGRTPSGVYPLETTFGYAESVNTKMPYRQARVDDLWVDDPNAPDYNRWVRQSKTRAASYEKMRRDDNLYKYGVIVEYNTNPVVKGHGSAIFLHVWKGPGATTAGCVAVSEEDILQIFTWLNPAANPAIVINPKSLEKESPK